MCQIVYSPKKSLLNMDHLKVSQSNNPDGFGITFAKDGKLFYCKKLADFEVFKKALKLVPEDVPLVIHFRWATHGDREKHNVHPFEVLSTLQGDSIDLCMAHNGTVSSIHTHGEKKSDTHMYVEKVLRPILKEAPDLIFNPGFLLLIQRDIGSSYNKFIFLRGDGKVAWVNKNLGVNPTEAPEVWYANGYSLTSSHRGTYSYDSRDRWKDHFKRQGLPIPGSLDKKDEKSTTVLHLTADGNNNSTGVIRNIYDNTPRMGEHENTQFFNFAETEINVPDEIKAHLKEGEDLLVNKFIDKVSLQGWGWVRYANNSARWDKHIRHLHKKWKLPTLEAKQGEQLDLTANHSSGKDVTTNISNITILPERSVDKFVLTNDTERELRREFESRYDEKNFRILNEPEILAWVLEFPDEASQWASKNGFFGSPNKIAEWMQDANGAIDYVADFIYNVSRGRIGKTLEDIEQLKTSKKVS